MAIYRILVGIWRNLKDSLIELNEVIGSAAISSLSVEGDPTWLFKGAIGLHAGGIQANLQNKINKNTSWQ